MRGPGAPVMALTAIAALVGFAVPGGATACACGEFEGPVVVRGESPHGVSWRIEVIEPETAGLDGQGGLFSFQIGGPSSDAGYFSEVPVPAPPAFVFTGTSGSSIDRFPESDLSGVTSSRVAMLRLTMSRGAALAVHPRLAPQPLLGRFGWLGEFRVFERFFAANRKVVQVTALDAEGHVLARIRSKQGSFG
jgi:hypothetical protein